MSKPNIKCQVCGGSEFALDEGFYFCLQCNTQSQDARDEVLDAFYSGQRVTTKVLQRKSDRGQGDVDKLTSWEVLNYILKGVTEQLIDLGASPKLKVVTLQLWASYLRKQEVAFLSTKIQRKPKLGYAFKTRDAEVVYGFSGKKTWRSRSSKKSTSGSSVSDAESKASAYTVSSTASRRSILQKLSHRKKALATAQYSQTSQDEPRTMSRTLEELDSESEAASASKSQKLRVTKHTKNLLRSASGSSGGSEKSSRKAMLRAEVLSVRNVTTAKLVAIINIALGLLQQDMLISDFIRWVEEGHISLATSRKFLPQEVKIDGKLLKYIEMEHMGHTRCQEITAAMCSELEIEALPLPDLSRLAQRYGLELQLPNELTEMVQRLLVLVTSRRVYRSPHSWDWRNCELLVMAAVLLVMKLLFSLDDCTEYRLSHTAAQLNRVKTEDECSVLLFSWSDWVQFTECRKAVVAAHHAPTRSAVYGEDMGRDIKLFMHHFSQTCANLPDVREYNRTKMLQKKWVEPIQYNLSKIIAEAPETVESGVEFPASLTPLYTCAQVLLTRQADQVAPVTHILRQDFTSRSLQHIVFPDQCIAFGLASDLNIKRERGAAASFVKEELSLDEEKDSVVIPRLGINKVNQTVNLVDKLGEEPAAEKTIETDSDQSPDDFEELVCDDSEEEEDDEESCDASQLVDTDLCVGTLELFRTGSQYWLSHVFMNRNTANEHFNQFAMKHFSSSFLWLLNECSRTIKVHSKELYAALIAVEKQHLSIMKEAKRIRNNKQKKM